MTINQATQQLIFELFHIYEDREARNIADLVMENITEWKRIDRVVNKQMLLSPDKQALLARYTEELLSHKPVQYVLSEAWFCGLKLYVNEQVLIPRPETEELADWILQDVYAEATEDANHGIMKSVHMLDMGTGSGCIAIALKKKWPGATVYACDVSERALEVAVINAASHNTEICFTLCDFLNEAERSHLPVIDILVSNPPYIPEHDKRNMHSNVVRFEPSRALFVQDENPWCFMVHSPDLPARILAEQDPLTLKFMQIRARRLLLYLPKKDFAMLN